LQVQVLQAECDFLEATLCGGEPIDSAVAQW
jgi:hypothetical protein